MAHDLASWHYGVARKNGLTGELQTRGEHPDLLRGLENLRNGAMGRQMAANSPACARANFTDGHVRPRHEIPISPFARPRRAALARASKASRRPLSEPAAVTDPKPWCDMTVAP